MTTSRKIRLILAVGSAVVAATPPAWSHQGYFTTYSHHVEKGELEVMIFSDFTSPSKPKRDEDKLGEYFSQMVELKYNPSDQLALEFMWEGFEDVEMGKGKFTGFRYEARYRLFQKEIPLNPMLYAEYEDLDPATRYKMEVGGWVRPPYVEKKGAEPTREKIMESRLILSQDLGPWNYAFNWINESDFHSGETGFGYSLGAFYRLHGQEQRSIRETSGHMHEARTSGSLVRPASIAFEFFGALGDSRRFGLTPSRQEHYFQPSLSFHIGQRSMLGVGYAIGLSSSSDDLARLTWGRKF